MEETSGALAQADGEKKCGLWRQMDASGFYAHVEESGTTFHLGCTDAVRADLGVCLCVCR